MTQKARAIVIHEKDTVAVALETLGAGSEVMVGTGGAAYKVKLASDIPMGHKFALCDMKQGQTVIKYGEPIGTTTAPIVRGEHVHCHNLIGQNETQKGDRG